MVILIDQRAHRFTAGAAAPAYRGVVGQVCNAILGELKVGDRLRPERLLAEQCGVSRSTLREAIRILTQAGILTVRRGATGGAFVARSAVSQNPLASALELTRAELLERLEARTLLKLPIVEFAAARATPAEVTLLEQVLGQLAVVDGRAAGSWKRTCSSTSAWRAQHTTCRCTAPFRICSGGSCRCSTCSPCQGAASAWQGVARGDAARRSPRWPGRRARRWSATSRTLSAAWSSFSRAEWCTHLGRQEAGAAYSTAISATTV
jgi:DNA-binding transcriptional regulator YhcF (GntR family)